MTASLAIEIDLGWTLWAQEECVAEDPRSTERELARAAFRGERDAFARLVSLHQRAVFALCVRLLRDREEAADAAQETFVKAYASLGGFDIEQPFAPWVLRIARNHCLDQMRRRVPAARLVELDAREDGEPARELADDSAVDPGERLDEAGRARTLEQAVAALPEKYRTVVTLYHQQHLSYQEIAKVMEIPLGTVMTWLHRARAQLREMLSGLEEATP